MEFEYGVGPDDYFGMQEVEVVTKCKRYDKIIK